MIFVLSHLAAGARALMLSHGVARLHADHFLSGGAMAAGWVAFAIMFGMCGASDPHLARSVARRSDTRLLLTAYCQ